METSLKLSISDCIHHRNKGRAKKEVKEKKENTRGWISLMSYEKDCVAVSPGHASRVSIVKCSRVLKRLTWQILNIRKQAHGYMDVYVCVCVQAFVCIYLCL